MAICGASKVLGSKSHAMLMKWMMKRRKREETMMVLFSLDYKCQRKQQMEKPDEGQDMSPRVMSDRGQGSSYDQIIKV